MLVRLEDDEYQAQLLQAKGQLANLRAKLDQALHDGCPAPRRGGFPVVSARWSACREWSTAVARRYLTASRSNETNLSQRTTASEPLDRAGGENFPVAARLLPATIRGHLLAIYTFARLVDDIGDEASGNRNGVRS